jgi:molybdopterin synthase sulfur carrier subunit
VKVVVRFFASIREALGSGESVDAEVTADIAAVRQALVARGGRYAEALGPDRSVRSARNRVLSAESSPLADGDEVGFFPPVTGG